MVEGPARSAGGSSLAPTIARREAAGALGKLFKNPRCQAGWNKNVLFGFS